MVAVQRDSLESAALAQLEGFERARIEVEQARARYFDSAVKAARALTACMPIRDAAVLMGISHQRVYQLIHEKRR